MQRKQILLEPGKRRKTNKRRNKPSKACISLYRPSYPSSRQLFAADSLWAAAPQIPSAYVIKALCIGNLPASVSIRKSWAGTHLERSRCSPALLWYPLQVQIVQGTGEWQFLSNLHYCSDWTWKGVGRWGEKYNFSYTIAIFNWTGKLQLPCGVLVSPTSCVWHCQGDWSVKSSPFCNKIETKIAAGSFHNEA